ncbi:uncharacterized protein LOC132564702 [Ylistrum balloti]|uniref:uncharacterized protein LOC132564702 n=1 Tax=Ylistrum balloti TaxID=509963 RepID=UPI002905D41B|nr:uncharacterized protein LOC132564702 [Ylistrum balloti]
MGNKTSRGDKQESQKEIFIHLYSEELSSHNVDGIVCFTDRKWSTDNTCCHLLAKHGGNHYTSDRHAIKHDNKDCQSGDVFVGAGGMLPCKKVMFCVVAENEVTQGSYDHGTVTMVTNMLDAASREDFFSVAILIGGSDASPNPTCLIPLIYCKFLVFKSSLQEIHLVSLDESLVDSMQKVLRESHELSLSQETALNDPGPRNSSPPKKEISHKEQVQKTSTQGKLPVSEETPKRATFLAHVDSYPSDDEDAVDEDYINNIMGIKDVKIQSDSVHDEVDSANQASESELGAVGGCYQSGNIPEFVQHCESSDDEYEDEFKKTMFKRLDSTTSTASQDENLDFNNIPNSVGKSKEGQLSPAAVVPYSPHSPNKGFVCSICFEEKGPLSQKKLEKCQHIFCKECIEKHLRNHGTCPVCKQRYSEPEGNQPDGIMSYFITKDFKVEGYESYGTIVIEYDIPDGIQTDRHPNPGMRYKGLHRSALLPDSPDGNRILALLMKAFDRKLIFTVGTSITTGRENVTTWNDIHHKTSRNGGPQRFGYPDPTYLRRVYDELIAKGITEDD